MKKPFRFVMAGLVAATMVTALYAAPSDGRQIRAKSFEEPAGQFDRAAHLQQMINLQERLTIASVDLSGALPLEVVLSPDERVSVRPEEAEQRKMRVGVIRDLSVPISFTRQQIVARHPMMHDTFGAVRGNDDGSFVWAGLVRSPQASAVRVHFTDFHMPEGAELYIYADNGMAFGPYSGSGPNGNGDFWSNTIAGSEIVLQIHAAAGTNPSFNIAGLGHMTDEFGIADDLAPRMSAAAAHCSFNATCVVGAGCTTGENAAVTVARDAVAHMLFPSGRYYYICSGGLVADSDASTNVPYFITANHCISKGSEASGLETFFFYRTETCNNCPNPGAANTIGASIVSTNRSSDYTLLRLNQNAPSGAAFLGWNATAVANSHGTHLYRLSHPQGAPQSYSEHDVDTSKVTCQSWPRGGWIYSRDVLGATEGGSSGSPVVNGAGQLVGQLSGGCGYNVNDECDSESNATVDGAFAAYYSSVASFLGSGDGGGDPEPDPDPTCTDADGDGFCVEDGDCNDNDAKVYPGAQDTKGKWGRDGVDNDCNGVIDG